MISNKVSDQQTNTGAVMSLLGEAELKACSSNTLPSIPQNANSLLWDAFGRLAVNQGRVTIWDIDPARRGELTERLRAVADKVIPTYLADLSRRIEAKDFNPPNSTVDTLYALEALGQATEKPEFRMQIKDSSSKFKAYLQDSGELPKFRDLDRLRIDLLSKSGTTEPRFSLKTPLALEKGSDTFTVFGWSTLGFQSWLLLEAGYFLIRCTLGDAKRELSQRLRSGIRS